MEATRFMGELGVDLTAHRSKSLDEIAGLDFDAVVTMGCGDSCPWVPARLREDWALSDPRDMDDEGYRAVRDEIGRRVRDLLAAAAADPGNDITLTDAQVATLAGRLMAGLPSAEQIADAVNDDAAARLAD